MAIMPEAPSAQTLGLILVSYLAGAVTPWYYMQERLRGMGRWFAQKLPYAPPPGEEEGEAMEVAVKQGEGSPELEGEDNNE